MPLKNVLIEAAQEVATDTIIGLIDNIDDNIDERRVKCAWWAVFHREMARTLPKRARLRRAWHRMMYRRMRAMCTANAVAHCKLEHTCG